MAIVLLGMEYLGPVAVVLAALVTGLITYLVSRRNTSGNVRQTPAEKLWDAAEGIRAELAKEVERQRAEIVGLRAELLLANQRITALEARING